jgi:CHAT domain-containing protein/uncharacterized protein YbgA (DUF1722 family)
MPISHAEPITLTCPACGASHTADIWLIVAPDERPDLLEQIRNGTLHTVICPQCSQTHTPDAPLLIFRPTAAPPILFSPAQQTTSEQDQQHAAALIGILRQRLGAAWNDAWLAQGPAVVPRPMLLVALTDDPAAALQGLAAWMQQALAELRRRDPEAFARLEAEAQQAMAALLAADQTPDEAPASAATADASALIQALDAFLNARTWIDSYREVQSHPELLSDEALALLEQRIAAARTVGNSRAVAFFEEHRALLRRCREVGAAAAFAEKIGVSVEQIRGVDAETALPPEVQQMIARITQLNRISDMPERVELCRQALTLVTRATHPRLWAALNVELGNSLVQNPRGERGENLEQAIALYQQALAVITREAMPVEWATTMMNLANAYSDRIRGDRAQNLEEAIAAYRQALEVMTREAMPVEWATTMMNLANAYYSRIRGDRAQNLEEAIAAYRQALEVMTREAMPVEWATTMMNLATAYYSRIRGDRAQNLEEAIAAYRQALEVMTREAMPVEWATTMMNLATAYSDRIRGDRAQNLEEAIAAYRQALEVRTREAMPVEWATTMMNLATAYSDRIRGDRAQNLEEAIAAYRQALEVRTREAMPVEWATTMMNLATAYYSRIRGDRAQNLEEAIAAYRQALEVRTREAMPVEWATTMMNLANAYYSRIRGDRAQNLEEAIAAYRQALEVMTREAMPVEWATTMMNLANAYYSRIRGDRAQNLEEAIVAYRQALEVRTREAMPVEWATTMMNLATAYYSRIRGDRAQNLEEAIAAYRQALEIFTPEGMPDDCRRTARQLGAMYAETGRWEAATGAYDLALQAAEILYGESVSPSGKAAELEATGTLFRSAAYALVRAARPGALHRAVEVAELGRARGLGETLTRDRSDLSVIERDYPDIYERYRTAAEIVRSLERTDRASADRQDTAQLSFTDLANRIRAARADLDAAIEAIRAIPGYEAFLRPPTYAEIAAAAQPGVPLVYLITTPQGSLALIVPDGNAEPEALLLDEFTENDLNNLLLVRTGDKKVVGGYLPGQLLGGEALTTALETALPLLGEHLIAPVAQRLRTLNATGVTLIPTGLLSLLPLHAATYTVNGASRCLLDEFDVAYAPSARVLSIAQREQQRRAAKGVRLAGVGNPLPSDETGDWALAELRRGLPNLRQQVQQVLPSLEAAAVRADPAMQKQNQDLLEIRRSTLTRLEELAQQTPEKVIKAGSDLARAAALFAALPADAVAFLSAIAARIPLCLTYARSELISILDLLPANAGAPLYEQQATREALWAVLSEATMAHFACHGQFGLDDTLDSALLLAQESRLTLRDLVAGDTTALSNLRLVALSACQTAITDFRRLPDESIGLPGGFLQAGVPAVVGTLWSVNDLSTALLMHRFYELHLHGDAAAGLAPQPPVRALRLAQQWLRDLTYKEMFAYFQRHRQLKAAPQRNLESVPVSGARMPTDLIEEGRALAEDYMLDHPNDRPYANPIFWAAFTFNGTIGGAA